MNSPCYHCWQGMLRYSLRGKGKRARPRLRYQDKRCSFIHQYSGRNEYKYMGVVSLHERPEFELVNSILGRTASPLVSQSPHQRLSKYLSFGVLPLSIGHSPFATCQIWSELTGTCVTAVLCDAGYAILLLAPPNGRPSVKTSIGPLRYHRVISQGGPQDMRA